MAASLRLEPEFQVALDVDEGATGGGTVQEDGLTGEAVEGAATDGASSEGGGSSSPDGGDPCASCGDAGGGGPAPSAGVEPIATDVTPDAGPVEDATACLARVWRAARRSWTARSADPLAAELAALPTRCVLALVLAAVVAAWGVREVAS